MADIPDEAVEAVARALNPEGWRLADQLKKGDLDRKYLVGGSIREAKKALTAAAPIIRADERRRVAEAVEAYVAEYENAYAIPGNPYCKGFVTGLELFAGECLAERNRK